MNEIYSKAAIIMNEHMQLNKKAMISMQSIGYNGFKRLHRCNAKEFLCWEIALANSLFDKYREKLNYTPLVVDYAPITLKDHLASWDAKLEESIKQLGNLNKEHFEKSGKTSCTIEEALGCMLKNYEKTGRWYKRFAETDWLAHDQHVLDDALHAKYKAIEEGER